MTVEYVPNTVQYGNCWQVRVNNGTEGTLTQTIGGTPIAGTFNVGHDSSGSYQAIVTFTAVAK